MAEPKLVSIVPVGEGAPAPFQALVVEIDQDAHPSHPIELPPGSAPENCKWYQVYCANPPPPHYEWLCFCPADPPERPQPQPPDPVDPPTTVPPGEKPPPEGGGWGYWPGVGWVYKPGSGQAGPKRR